MSEDLRTYYGAHRSRHIIAVGIRQRGITNAEFARTDEVFKKACELSGLPFAPAPLHSGRKSRDFEGRENHDIVRQASKYRNKRGIAWRMRRKAIQALSEQKEK